MQRSRIVVVVFVSAASPRCRSTPTREPPGLQGGSPPCAAVCSQLRPAWLASSCCCPATIFSVEADKGVEPTLLRVAVAVRTARVGHGHVQRPLRAIALGHGEPPL